MFHTQYQIGSVAYEVSIHYLSLGPLASFSTLTIYKNFKLTYNHVIFLSKEHTTVKWSTIMLY
jgi:hypothetical protein